MASNDVDINQIQSTSGNTFDFNQWIKEHQLCEIKDLLLKHDLNKINTLSLTSPQYIQFLCDPQLLQTKSHFIPNIVKAIQSLNNTSHRSLKDCIVISEAEESAMEALKQHIVELKSTEINIKELKVKYPELIQRIKTERDKQIETAQQKIKYTFKNIQDAVNKREQYLLNELDTIKEGNIDNDDGKESELFVNIENALTKEIKKINENLELCDKTIMSHKNENREKRKERVLNIGKQCDEAFNLEIQNINKTAQMIKELISKKENYPTKISCIINELTYNKLLNCINILGIIENFQEGQEHHKRNNDAEEVKEVDLATNEKARKMQKKYDDYYKPDNSEEGIDIELTNDDKQKPNKIIKYLNDDGTEYSDGGVTDITYLNDTFNDDKHLKEEGPGIGIGTTTKNVIDRDDLNRMKTKDELYAKQITKQQEEKEMEKEENRKKKHKKPKSDDLFTQHLNEFASKHEQILNEQILEKMANDEDPLLSTDCEINSDSEDNDISNKKSNKYALLNLMRSRSKSKSKSMSPIASKSKPNAKPQFMKIASSSKNGDSSGPGQYTDVDFNI